MLPKPSAPLVSPLPGTLILCCFKTNMGCHIAQGQSSQGDTVARTATDRLADGSFQTAESSRYFHSACLQGGEEICKRRTERLLTCRVKLVWDGAARRGQLFSPGTLSVFSTAGSFSLMRKAKWGRQTCLMPWRRSRRNTTVSYRQTPQRTKYDGPREPEPNPPHVWFLFCFFFLFASMEWETPQRGLICSALDSRTLDAATCSLRAHVIVRRIVHCHPQELVDGADEIDFIFLNHCFISISDVNEKNILWQWKKKLLGRYIRLYSTFLVLTVSIAMA